MGEERIFLDAQLVALALHDVDRVVQHALDQEVTQLAHEHMRLWEMPQRHRQRADMIMVAMRNGDGVQFLVLDQMVKERQAGAALPFGMDARIHQQPVSLHLHKPGGGADVGVRIEISDSHNPT